MLFSENLLTNSIYGAKMKLQKKQERTQDKEREVQTTRNVTIYPK